MTSRLIIAASPCAQGRSALLAQALCAALLRVYPSDSVTLISLCDVDISFCRGCDACKHSVWNRAINEWCDDSKPGEAPRAEAGTKPGTKEGAASPHITCENTSARCVVADDMYKLYQQLDVCDELLVVSPVYFAGPPANFKAFLDRLQPYFWTDIRLSFKRPAHLYVVGTGTDSHGFVPLVGIVRSALAVAGFRLEYVHDWVGYPIDDKEFLASVDPLLGGGVHTSTSYTESDPYGIYPRYLRHLHQGLSGKDFR